MAEVLSGLGSLFAASGGATPSPIMGTGLLQPEILNQAKELTQGSGGFGSIAQTQNPIFSEGTLSQLKTVKEQGEKNVRNAMPMMQLGPIQQGPQIQQMDLAALLRALSGVL